MTIPTVDDAIHSVSVRHDDTITDRELLRAKLRTMITKIPDDGLLTSKDLEAATTLFNSFNTTLNEIDKQKQIEAKLVLSKKQTDDNEATGELVVRYLREFNANKQQVAVDLNKVSDTVDTIYEQQCDPILDSELE